MPEEVREHTALILVVEDDEINQLVTSHILKRQGYRVDTASNGLIAVNKVQSGHFDLVLMDLEMPIMDGLEATLRIRQGASASDVPIIAVSGHSREELSQEFADSGINDYLIKPYDASVLRELIEKYVRK